MSYKLNRRTFFLVAGTGVAASALMIRRTRPKPSVSVRPPDSRFFFMGNDVKMPPCARTAAVHYLPL